MSKGWALGSREFKKELIKEHKEAALALQGGGHEADELKQLLFNETLDRLLKKIGKQRPDLLNDGKSVVWKIAVAAAMKQKTTATNRWLGENLHLGNVHEVSRKINRWLREPESRYVRTLSLTPSPMV